MPISTNHLCRQRKAQENIPPLRSGRNSSPSAYGTRPWTQAHQEHSNFEFRVALVIDRQVTKKAPRSRTGADRGALVTYLSEAKRTSSSFQGTLRPVPSSNWAALSRHFRHPPSFEGWCRVVEQKRSSGLNAHCCQISRLSLLVSSERSCAITAWNFAALARLVTSSRIPRLIRKTSFSEYPSSHTEKFPRWKATRKRVPLRCVNLHTRSCMAGSFLPNSERAGTDAVFDFSMNIFANLPWKKRPEMDAIPLWEGGYVID